MVLGNDVLVASGCRFIDHDHGFLDLTKPMNRQHGDEAAIRVMDDVWIGANVVILKGCVIEKGAIVAAGAVLTKSVPAYEIWGGVPAKRIGSRLVNAGKG